MWNSPVFVFLKTIAIFLIAVFILKDCNHVEATEAKSSEPQESQEREHIPEVKQSEQGYAWRCETWNKRNSYGWGEHNILEYAAAISMINCGKTPNGENCSRTPICRYKKPYDRNNI